MQEPLQLTNNDNRIIEVARTVMGDPSTVDQICTKYGMGISLITSELTEVLASSPALMEPLFPLVANAFGWGLAIGIKLIEEIE